MKKISLALLLLSASLMATNHDKETKLTNEQKVANTMAHVQGANFRHQKMSIKECNKFTSMELDECKEGYRKTDEMYKSR